jgi:hypothetical protein
VWPPATAVVTDLDPWCMSHLQRDVVIVVQLSPTSLQHHQSTMAVDLPSRLLFHLRTSPFLLKCPSTLNYRSQNVSEKCLVCPI